MKPIIIEDSIIEFEPFDEDGSVWMAEEPLWRGMADELQELHYLKGAQFIKQLKLIINSGEFRPIEGETHILSAITEISDDFDNLINAARKAVEHGYMKNKSHLSRVAFKWSRGDKVLLPALSGVVKTIVLTLQR